MSWWETLAAPFRRLRPEVLAALAVVAVVVILSWANRDLREGLSTMVTQYPSGLHAGPAAGGAGAGLVGPPMAAAAGGGRDATAEMMAQAQHLLARLNVETNHVTALQMADTATALLAVIGTQRPDLAPQTQPMLASVQSKRAQLASHIMGSMTYA